MFLRHLSPAILKHLEAKQGEIVKNIHIMVDQVDRLKRPDKLGGMSDVSRTK